MTQFILDKGPLLYRSFWFYVRHRCITNKKTPKAPSLWFLISCHNEVWSVEFCAAAVKNHTSTHLKEFQNTLVSWIVLVLEMSPYSGEKCGNLKDLFPDATVLKGIMSVFLFDMFPVNITTTSISLALDREWDQTIWVIFRPISSIYCWITSEFTSQGSSNRIRY